MGLEDLPSAVPSAAKAVGLSESHYRTLHKYSEEVDPEGVAAKARILGGLVPKDCINCPDIDNFALWLEKGEEDPEKIVAALNSVDYSSCSGPILENFGDERPLMECPNHLFLKVLNELRG